MTCDDLTEGAQAAVLDLVVGIDWELFRMQRRKLCSLITGRSAGGDDMGIMCGLEDWLSDLGDIAEDKMGVVLPQQTEVEELADYEADVVYVLHPDLVELRAADMWSEHPVYKRVAWQFEAGQGDTQLGYWEWCSSQLADEEAQNLLASEAY